MAVDVEQAVREYIDKTVHMSLATLSGNRPWVCEVHFAYDEDLNLYFRSLKTRRHSQEIAANPNVAGNIVDKYVVGEAPVGVYFEGTARLLEPGDEQNKAFEVLHARVGASNDAIEEAAQPDGHQFYKITVENWYVFGRFGADHGEKYQLPWDHQ